MLGDCSVGVSGISSSTTSVPQKQSQTEEQLSNCSKEVEVLGNILNQLEERLRPLLRENDQKDGIEAPEQVLVGLANAIRDIKVSVNNKRNKLSSILERLEI